MRLYLVRVIGVPFNREIEAPGIVHECLPDISTDAIFLRLERRVVQIFKQERRLLIERTMAQAEREPHAG